MAEDPVATTAVPTAGTEKTVDAAPAAADAAAAAEPSAATAAVADTVEKAETAEKSEAESTAIADVNGHPDSAKAPNGELVVPVPASEDVTMQDADATLADATPAKATPQRKSIGNGSAKRRSGGVPEHKSKKLNRKKSKPMLQDVKPGQMYLARMKGHQPWPSIICDEEMLPQILLGNRPVSTALPDGSYKRPEYADGGKRAHERTYPVMFLHTNEFAWMPNGDLTPTVPEECAEAADKAKSKNLAEAHKVAAEGHDLDYFKSLLKDHEDYVEAEAAERAEKEAEKEAKKVSKDKRKSDVAAAAADEMDVDGGKPASKKRKKEGTNEDDGKPPKQAKADNKKLILKAPKTPSDSSAKKASKPKAAAKKGGAKAGSDDDSSPKPTEKQMTPAEALEKKEKDVRYIRHKLQKGFLGRDTPPTDEELKQMSFFLEKVENFSEIEGSILRATKIHKVLKAMIKLESIPMDDTYRFTPRAQALLSRWNKVLAEDPATAEKQPEKKTEGAETEDKADKPAEKPAEESKPSEEAKADKPAKPEPTKEDSPEEPAQEKAAEDSNTEEAKAEEPKADEPKAADPAAEKPAEAEVPAPVATEAAA